MGCSGSKAEDLPLVARCRERRDLIRAAANHRYSLASAHVSYFRSLKHVGDALRRFVDEELVAAASTPPSSSASSSPSLILPPDSKRNQHDNADRSPSPHLQDDDDESHLHLSDSSSEDDESADHAHHFRNHHHHHRQNQSDDDDDHNVEEIRSNFYPNPRGNFAFAPNGYNSNEFGFDPYLNPYPHRPFADPYVDPWAPPPAQQPWYYSNNSNVYYMKKSAPAAHTVVQEPPAYGYSDSYWNPGSGYTYAPKMDPNKEAPPPPPSPKASAWDFFNPFDGFDSGYPDYYSGGRNGNGYGYGSNYSSPDSSEVREREGIPDLEEETESEVYKEVVKGKNRVKVEGQNSNSRSRALPVRRNREGSSSRTMPIHTGEGSSRTMPMHTGEGSSRTMPHHTGEGSSRTMPQHTSEGSLRSRSGEFRKSEGKSRSVPMRKSESSSKSVPSWSSEESEKPSLPPHYNEETEIPSMLSEKPSTSPTHGEGASWVDSRDMEGSISLTDDKSSSENVVSKSVDESSVRKKGVTFEVEESSKQDGESSKLSSVTLMSPRGTRDLQEVVAEIRDDFETAAGYGKEVAMMLEVGKLPYQPSLFKAIVSRILYPMSPSLSLRDPPSLQSAKLASKTMKLAKSYFEDVGKDVNSKACNLSSTMDTLYAWEKKLYKEVKDEEKLRIMYEKQCKKLKTLDEEGAESTKIDAVRASIRRLLTKLDVSVKAIDSISVRIHKLRDEELQPQVAQLIHGLIRMWKAMLKCHQKQFQAVMESKMRRLRANTALQSDPTSRASSELERELRAWCHRFSEWVRFQKSYVESLNGWLAHCLNYEPEQTPDGPAPYSPGRLGAPPIFVICNDWQQAMQAISEARVANAMNTFATSLHQLWVKQDEEGRQRLKAEYLSKDYEKQLRDKMSEKTGMSVVQSDSGVSRLDDLKVDLDSMREKLAEERVKHKDAMKLVNDAASRSLQGGLVPIFKALESFSSEALKAHEHVRLQHPGTRL